MAAFYSLIFNIQEIEIAEKTRHFLKTLGANRFQKSVYGYWNPTCSIIFCKNHILSKYINPLPHLYTCFPSCHLSTGIIRIPLSSQRLITKSLNQRAWTSPPDFVAGFQPQIQPFPEECVWILESNVFHYLLQKSHFYQNI